VKGKAMGLNPNTYDPSHFDPETRRKLRAVIEWFEGRGKARLLRDDLEAAWVSDFLDFIKRRRSSRPF
jgi:acyl-CoA dehydrogenase